MKTISLLTVFVLLAFFSASAETEPNNTLAQANTLTYNGSESGSLTGTDTEDWFVINIPQGGIFTLSFKKTGAGYAFAYLYDGEKAGNPEIAGRNLPFGDSPAEGWSLSAPLLKGKYFLKILKTADPVEYQVNASLVLPSFPDDTEPNDTLTKAISMPLTGSVSGNLRYYGAGEGPDNQDWYKIQLSQGGLLKLAVHKKGKGNTWVHFLDGIKSGFPEISNFYTGFSESPDEGWTWSYPVLAGIYYFQVQGGEGVVDYKLDVAFSPPAYGEDKEPNDTITKALTMPVPGSVSGNIRYYVDGKGPDGEDWYKLQVLKGGILNLIIHKKGPGNTFFRFRDGMKTGNPEISQYYTGFGESPSEGWKWSYPVLAGTYYFQVSGGENTLDYQMDVSLADPAFAEDLEPNDTITKSLTMPVPGSVSGNIRYYADGKGADGEDWYKIQVTKGGILNLIIHKKGPGNAWIRFRDGMKPGTPEISNSYTGFSESPPEGWNWSFPVLSGTYYFQVSGGENIVDYKLDVSQSDPLWGEDTEPNDSLKYARSFAINDSVPGLIGYYKTGVGPDNWDWFVITTPEYGYLSFIVSKKGYNNGNILLRDTIVDISGQYLGFGDQQVTFGKNVPKGKYYLGFQKYEGDYQYKARIKFIPMPQAEFTWARTDNSFAFENKTLQGESYQWNFDDGTKSTAVNPFHDFTIPKNYNVSLIAGNITGSDTVSHLIIIPGVTRIFPDRCGNEGEATIEIFGGGLDTTYDEKIVSGNTVLGVSAMTGIGGKSSILAIFDSLSIAPGKYDFVIEKPGGPSYKLPGGFTVMATTEAKPWLRIVGRNRILFNTWTTYTIEVGNSGNKDAHGVPLWIAISDLPGTDLAIENINRKAFNELMKENGWTLNLDSIPDFVQVDTVMGKPWKAKVYPLYIPFIQAGTTNSIMVKVRTSQEIQFKAWLQPKYFNSGATDAVWCFISLLGKEATGFVIDRFSAKGKCIFDILVKLYSLKGIIMRDPNGPRGISIIPWLWGWANSMAKCGMAFNEALGILKHFADAVSKYSQMSTSIVDCLMAADAANQNITPANSLDPNEKTGPSGFGAENYVAGGRNFPYTIYFENKASATAPAHTITVSDELDISKFDLTTFSFGNVVIGDSIFTAKPGLKEFAIDRILKKQKVVARISGKLDTLTGKLEWKLRSLDPVTFADIEDPDFGLLPPNKISPEGQGSVSFNIRLKNDPAHKGAVTNQASIVFDANPAIVTNIHLTTFDLAAPQSTVQALTSSTTARQFTVKWSGTDDGSGIGTYNIYVSKNNDPFNIWLAGTAETSAVFQSPSDGTFKFASVAVDQTGNSELMPAVADASTNVVTAVDETGMAGNDIIVYPACVKNEVEVMIPLSGHFTFRIYGYDGRLRIAKHLEGNSATTIKTTELSPGLYLWQLVNEYATVKKSGKFVVTD